MLRLLLVAAAIGLSNFAASIGIGISGVDARLRVRIAVVFGLFETTMPLIGLLLGHGVARSLGSATAYVGGGLLVATGIYEIVRRADAPEGQTPRSLGRLVTAGLALSIDNLVVGFALGTVKGSLAVAILTIGTISVAMSLIGLELGHRLGRRVERWSEEIGGAVLILVGIAIATGLL